MKKIVLLVITTLIIASSCSEDILSHQNKNQNTITNQKISISNSDLVILQKDMKLNKTSYTTLKDHKDRLLAHEIRCKYFAQALALSLNDKNVISYLSDEGKKKFDGDTEVLWDMVKDEIINDKKISKHISNKFNKNDEILSLEELENVPLLNILFCQNFYEYLSKEEIKVAFVPLSKNDVEAETVIAYDSELNEYEISNFDPPKFPLIAIGINERVDYDTKELNKLAKSTITGDMITLYEVWLYDDEEPVTAGAAEIEFETSLWDVNKNRIDMDVTAFKNMDHDNQSNPNDGHWASSGTDEVSWLPQMIVDADEATSAKYFSIKVMERDVVDDDIVEQYWDTSPTSSTTYKIPFSYNSGQVIKYYGCGNERGMDVRIQFSWNQ